MSQRTLRSTAAARHHGVARRPRRVHDRARHARGHDRAPGRVLRVQLHAGLSGLEWTVNPYNLAFACCLLTGAALGDRFGRRRTLGTGLALSTAASAACALSSGVETSETVCWPAMRTARLSVRIPLARAPGSLLA
jgi:MFS family permease